MVLRLLGMEMRRCTRQLPGLRCLAGTTETMADIDQGAEMAPHAHLTITPAFESTSAIHRFHGNAPPTRMPMGSSASTFQRAPI